MKFNFRGIVALACVALAGLTPYALADNAGPQPDLRIGALPSDPYYMAAQWHIGGWGDGYRHIGTPAAWDITTGSTNVVLAVLDTGCATNLAEFTGRIVAGYNFVAGNSNVMDDNWHGTAVAGVAAGNADNGSNGAGVDWLCRIMPVKVLDAEGSGYTSDLVNGIDWAVSNGADVLNLSLDLAPGNTNESLRAAISNAISEGVVVVVIAGNQGTNVVTFPGTMPEAITVGATSTNGTRWISSNFGPDVDLVAPGHSISTVATNGSQISGSGTSFAAPQVSGAATLLLALRPGLTHLQVRTLLCAGAVDQAGPNPEDTTGFDYYTGWGLLNVHNTLILSESRINDIARDDVEGILLSWSCPGNASNRLPYRIGYAGDMASHSWVTSSAVAYDGTNALWNDDAFSATNRRFYRLSIVVE